MKTKVEKCNQILFACIALVDVFVTNLRICLFVVFVFGREVITVPQNTPYHEVVCVSGGVDPYSENSRTTRRWHNTFTLRMCYRRGKSARYFSDNTSVDGTQSRSGPCGEEKNACPWWEFIPDYAFRSLATILTKLYMHPRLIAFRETLSSETKHILYLICWNIWTIGYKCCIEYIGWIRVLQPTSSFHFAIFHTPECWSPRAFGTWCAD
jgi:hypothetical protein